LRGEVAPLSTDPISRGAEVWKIEVLAPVEVAATVPQEEGSVGESAAHSTENCLLETLNLHLNQTVVPSTRPVGGAVLTDIPPVPEDELAASGIQLKIKTPEVMFTRIDQEYLAPTHFPTKYWEAVGVQSLRATRITTSMFPVKANKGLSGMDT
jgi:hypothetical protein